MEETNFINYFDMDKEKLKDLLRESSLLVRDLTKTLQVDPDDRQSAVDLENEKERHRAIKLALIACDNNAMLTTVDLDEYGTLDVNVVYGEMKNKFDFDFTKKPASFNEITPPETPPKIVKDKTPPKMKDKTPSRKVVAKKDKTSTVMKDKTPPRKVVAKKDKTPPRKGTISSKKDKTPPRKCKTSRK